MPDTEKEITVYLYYTVNGQFGANGSLEANHPHYLPLNIKHEAKSCIDSLCQQISPTVQRSAQSNKLLL